MSVRTITGDCREVLRTLSDESVHCVVTSPPYFGLRDYGSSGQIGLESTPEAYVTELVDVFREVRRVLRKDGTCWLNLGDSYSTHAAGKVANPMAKSTLAGVRTQEIGNASSRASGMYLKCASLPEKNLIGIPWRVAFALQADGWYLRQDIIWSKPNPMPESVRDRCTKAHEYLFLLSKSERYFYDVDAIAEELAESTVRIHSSSSVRPQGTGADWKQYNVGNGHSGLVNGNLRDGKRNRRSVWEVATQPFSEAHFATFPPALIEPCIKAGCPEKCCAKCGAPWVRRIDVESRPNVPSCMGKYDGVGKHRTVSGGVSNDARERRDMGAGPSCSCNAGTIPGTVLDPFGGAGTTGLVADRLQRNAVLVELNPAYAEMARKRMEDDAPLFLEAAE